MSNPKIAINIVTWNSEKYIRQCLDSVTQQTFKDFSVLIIDNASTDDTMKYVSDFKFQVLKNEKNLGFAAAHNQGIERAIQQGAKYVLVMNPDIILEPNYLEKVIKIAEDSEGFGSFGGKLLRLTNNSKSDIIDSTGLKILKTRQTVERGAGQKDKGQNNQTESVFGISGALALYRVKALEDTGLKKEYYDEDFFIYKEDIDLAWRLQLAGWKSLYIPQAIAYHARRVGKESSRQSRSKSINYYSYKNHLFLLIKNEFISNLLQDYFYIKWYELKKFIYLLLFERSTLKALGEVLRKLPRMIAKRKVIMKKRKVNAEAMRQWISQ